MLEMFFASMFVGQATGGGGGNAKGELSTKGASVVGGRRWWGEMGRLGWGGLMWIRSFPLGNSPELTRTHLVTHQNFSQNSPELTRTR